MRLNAPLAGEFETLFAIEIECDPLTDFSGDNRIGRRALSIPQSNFFSCCLSTLKFLPRFHGWDLVRMHRNHGTPGITQLKSARATKSCVGWPPLRVATR